MSENNFTNTVESLFKGMDAFITTKTVVGDAVRFDDGTKLVNVKNQDGITKILDMVPDFVDKFAGKKNKEQPHDAGKDAE